ncbi:MAG: hypothetical protein U9Q04_06815 [Campylobacterota bacterium]|nr:hypothetical protein [Campylobacterota bacterium]
MGNRRKQSDRSQQENILKLLQWGNYSEVNDDSTTHFKNKQIY